MLLKKIYLYPYFWWSREFGTGSDQKWPKETKFINHIYLDNLLMMSTPGFWMFLLSILFIDERIRDRYPVAGIMSANAGWASKSLTWKNKNVIKKNQIFFLKKLKIKSCKRRIFKTFWKIHGCPNFLFFELETLNLGSWLISNFA